MSLLLRIRNWQLLHTRNLNIVIIFGQRKTQFLLIKEKGKQKISVCTWYFMIQVITPVNQKLRVAGAWPSVKVLPSKIKKIHSQLFCLVHTILAIWITHFPRNRDLDPPNDSTCLKIFSLSLLTEQSIEGVIETHCCWKPLHPGC